jgi:uncharacterized protein (DUF952 family)
MPRYRGESYRPMDQTQERDRATGTTYHLTPAPVWHAHQGHADYLPEGFAAEGFVHTTNDETHVLDVANRYYREDTRPFLLLDVDLAQVRSPTVYDDPARRYPHVYGPIPTAAVIRVRHVERGADGTCLRIGAEAQ